ncbi:MAG: N-acetylmuramoyl-L-alanine amidase [Syntrophobacterales bacterium]|nr:N-acetylmuramoyl-L-alanine amidase [Syntrophobacterales bacterium]
MKIISSALLIVAFLILSSPLEGKENSPSRKLHYIKDVTLTKNLSSAKLILSFDSPVSYRFLEKKHGRAEKKLILRIENCVVNPRIERIQPDKTFIRLIQIANHYSNRSGSSAEIVISSPRDVEFSHNNENNPFRIVITMTKQITPEKPSIVSHQDTSVTPEKQATPVFERDKVVEPSPLKSLSDLRLIVIDPGHGGRDKGATGYRGIYEKDLTLTLAKSLKSIIEASVSGIRVELTRYRDEYVSLEQRVKIANSLKADLFISLHFNAHENRLVRGIETYYLNISQDKEAARVAAIENAVLRKKMTDLEAILQDLLKASSIAESARLAKTIHGNIVDSLRGLTTDIKDLGVKSAPFYVLFGTTMPGILIEAGFISNREELELIKSSQFAQAIAKGILEGVKLYAEGSVHDRPSLTSQKKK